MGEEAIVKKFADLRARKSPKAYEAMKKLLRKNKSLLTYLVPNLYQNQPIPIDQLCNQLSKCVKKKTWSRTCVKGCLKELESISYVQRSEDGYIITDNFHNWLRAENLLADLQKGKKVIHL